MCVMLLVLIVDRGTFPMRIWVICPVGHYIQLSTESMGHLPCESTVGHYVNRVIAWVTCPVGHLWVTLSVNGATLGVTCDYVCQQSNSMGHLPCGSLCLTVNRVTAGATCPVGHYV